MVIFNVPDVGHFKPETLYGQSKPSHYGFIQENAGIIYSSSLISKRAMDYYDKKNNPKYWGQIITLFRLGGLKKISENGNIMEIPLQSFIQRQYDMGNVELAKMWFNHFLCKWQYPIPLSSKNRDFSIIKPYSLVLLILIELHNINEKYCYLTGDEFYWFIDLYYKNKSFRKNINPIKITSDILTLRNDGGWKEFNNIKNNYKTLSYPQALLNHSKILTKEKSLFNLPNDRKLFIGLNTHEHGYLKLANQIIEYSSNNRFEFNPEVSYLDTELEREWSNYLQSPKDFINWIKTTDLYKNDYAKELNWQFYGR